MMCPPLPGQVPVEPAVTSNGLIAQGAVEVSPANKSSTGEIEIGVRGVKCTDFAILCIRLLQVFNRLISSHIYRCSA